jgi:predicted PurR-regulated permease PerM
VGPKLYAVWSLAYDDFPALVQRMQPKIGELAKAALGFVAAIGSGLLQFIFAFIIAGIVMAFGRAGGRGSRAIFERVAGNSRGAELTRLSVATIRSVALGVIGVDFIQALLVRIILLFADVPWAGVLALVVLVLGIAQVPALIVTLPAIGYIWWSADYGTVPAVIDTLLLLVSGMADNVLKPLLLGRGVEAPMPVILLGALGGMAAAGILGLFVGATLFAMGYQIFMGWVATGPDPEPPGEDVKTPAVG